MRKKKLMFRIAAIFIALLLVLQVFAPMIAQAEDEYEEVENYNGATFKRATGTRLYSHDTAAGEISKIMSEAESAFGLAYRDESAVSAVENYGKLLLCMHWISTSAFRVIKLTTDANGAESKTFTGDWLSAFEYYGEPISTNTLQEAAGKVYNVYSQLQDMESLTTGSINETIGDASIVSAPGDILTYTKYKTAFIDLLREYIDYNVLRILAEDHNITLSGSETASDLEDTVMGIDEVAAAMAATSDERTTLILSLLNGGSGTKQTKHRIEAYINALLSLEKLSNDLASSAGKHSDGIASPSGDASVTYGYEPYRRDDAVITVFLEVSSITSACMNAIKSTSSPGNINDTTTPGSESLEIDLSGGFLSALANVTLTRNGVVINDGTSDIKLSQLGWIVLAAGVVYEPFSSKAGDEAYIATLNRFVPETDREKLNSTLRTALNTKKPLYMSEDSLGILKDEMEISELTFKSCTPATLANAFHEDRGVLRIYFMLKGSLEGSADSSTFEYVQTNSQDASIDPTIRSGNTADIADNEFRTVSSGGTASYTADQVTRPLMFTAGRENKAFSNAVNGYYAGLGGLTELILNNAKQDYKDSNLFTRADTEFLFMNGLGDVVLADGTMVLPAIANPALWNYSDSYKTGERYDNENAWWFGAAIAGISGAADFLVSLGKSIFGSAGTTRNTGEFGADTSVGEYDPDTATRIIDEEAYQATFGRNYYPYNAAFCNHYPKLSTSLGASGSATLSNKADVGKMMLQQQERYASVATIADIKNDGGIITHRQQEISGMPMQAYCFSPGSDASEAITMFELGLSSGTGEHWWQVRSGSTVGAFVIPNYRMSAGGLPFFPMSLDDPDVLDSYLQVSAPAVTSCIRYLTTSVDSDGRTDAGTANISLWIEDMVGQGLLGNQYAEQMAKNLKLDYEDLVNDQYNRFSIFLRDIIAAFANSVGHIDGVLSMKDGYGNGFFNVIVGFVQEFYLLFCVVLLLAISVKFLKGHYNLLYIALIGCLTIAAFQVYAVWMPTAIPSVYNMFVNDIVEDVTWGAVTVKAEQYEETYKNSSRVDSVSGKPRPYTATVTLYKLTQAEMEEIALSAGVDVKQIRKGDVIYLDQTAGIFVQGDQIKLSVDKLLTNNTMRGLYRSQWETINSSTEEVEPISVQSNDNPYIVKLTNPYVSLESYYTPFSQFERAFLVNLNNFANIFRIQRNVFSYANGEIHKDGFLFGAFTGSGIFLDPSSENTDDTLMQNVKVEDITGSYMADIYDVIGLCHQYMDPFEDWLNLRSVFANPSESMRESLWGKMLMQQEYYNSDWTMSSIQEERVTDLIYYINSQTKQFILRNQDQLMYCSDENAIKLVALFATTCFTHRVSQFGYWLYPNYINSSDIELYDALYGSMTTVKDRNVSLNSDLINTMMLQVGVPGLLLIFAIILFSVIFIFIMTYLIPVLYVMFGVILVFKILNDEATAGMIKGYAKATFTTVALYVLYSFGLRFAKFGGYQWYGYLGCALIIMFCAYMLLYVVMSVVSNPLELGNDVLAKNLFNALDRLTGRNLSRLTTNSIHVNARNSYGHQGIMGGMRNYMRRTSLDMQHMFRFPRRRGYGYGRYNDLDYDYGYGYNSGYPRRRGLFGGFRRNTVTSWSQNGVYYRRRPGIFGGGSRYGGGFFSRRRSRDNTDSYGYDEY